MKIMKTNLLLLDNKRKNELAEVNRISTNQSMNVQKTGMNALMFQGMQNVMANPRLAEKLGLADEETVVIAPEENTENTENAANNVSFKANKFKTGAMIAALGLATLGSLSSCKIESNHEASQSVEVKVDTKALENLVAGLQSTLLQMYAQGQLSQEKFDQYMADTEAWRTQMAGKVDAMSAILNIIAQNTFDLKDGQQAIYDQNNALHRSLIDYLSNFMNKDEAIGLFNKMYSLVATGQKNEAEAFAELIQLAQERNQKLDTIIGKMDDAFAQRESIIGSLQRLENIGEATEEAVQAIKANTAETNNILRNGIKDIKSQLLAMDCHNTNAIRMLAQQNNCSTQRIIDQMNKLGIKIDNNTQATFWTGDRLAGALDMIDQSINNQTNAINGFHGDFNNFAGYALNTLQGIDCKVGAGIQILAKHACNVNNALNSLQGSANYANMKLDYIAKNTDIIKQEGANIEGILKVISCDVKNIKGNVSTIAELANHWGITPEELMQAVCYLGYSINEVQTWNADRIIDVLQNSFNEQNELIGANGKKLDKLTVVANSILAELRGYIKNSLEAFSRLEHLNWETQLAVREGNLKLGTIVEQNKTAEQQRAAIYNAMATMKTLIEQLKSCGHDNMTAAEFKQILKEQSQDDYQMYSQLLNNFKFDVNVDTKPVEDLLNEIICIKQQESQTWNKMLALMEKYPQYLAEIKQAIIDKQYIFNCTCKADCEHNEKVHEGCLNDLENILG